jgi:hypothetical protein
MSAGCLVKVLLCYTEQNEITKWDAECDEQRFQWTDTFAHIRSAVSSGTVTQKFQPSVQDQISAMLSKGKKHCRMYVVPASASGNTSSLPLEVTDEDLSVRFLCYSY